MVSILICDDDIVMLNRIKSVIEPVLADTETKAKIHAFSDAEQISDQILSCCDIALLDIKSVDRGISYRICYLSGLHIFVCIYSQFALFIFTCWMRSNTHKFSVFIIKIFTVI